MNHFGEWDEIERASKRRARFEATAIVLVTLVFAILFSIFAFASARADERPWQCPQRAWCGCAASLKVFGENRRELWNARAWLKLGRPVSKPAPGVIAVYARGKGRGHVGIVTAVPGPHRIVLWSGNDLGAIRERERSTDGILGYRKL